MNTGTLSSSRGKAAVGAILITMFLFAFAYALPTAVCGQVPEAGIYQNISVATYQNISVQVAHRMIEKHDDSPILILDVRYQCEYDLGHLYGAVLMPYDQLQANISRFQAYKNQVIIVYCKAGLRSAIASGILASNTFTRVYNIEGGIFAWINAGYQIYTTYHYATVDATDGEVLMHIEPLLLQAGAPPCTQGKACSNGSAGGSITNFQSTVLEQDEDHTLTRVTFEVNGTAFEFIVTKTLVWSYSEVGDDHSRIASLTSIETTWQNWVIQLFDLRYLVQHEKYNLTIQTFFTPSNSEVYNSSATMVTYVPADDAGPTSWEYIGFNSSVTLSGQYAILGKVAQRIGKIYAQSQDKNLARLAWSYHRMSEEADYLSYLAKTQLQGYDKRILKTVAVLTDQTYWDCVMCAAAIVLLYAAYPSCSACAGCLVACYYTFGFWWCAGCLIVPCTLCILSLATIVYSCYQCARYLGLLP